MDKKLLLGIAGLIALIFFMFAFKPTEYSEVPEELQCNSDAECVPASDCHASTCINENFKQPSEVFCTMNCEPGTLDCGQGECKCISNQCEAIIE